MNNVNKTLYIPLYGKAFVSKNGVILKDKKAEEIWKKEGFQVKGKSKSKWLAYYMGMRSRVFDCWLETKTNEYPDAIIIHLGCGLDSRVERVGTKGHFWYDIDFPDVIEERHRYYNETNEYHMIASDVRDSHWLNMIQKNRTAIVVMEGISMYLSFSELESLFTMIQSHFKQVFMLMDCYTVFGANISKYKNPINDVGVTTVYGLDSPKQLEATTKMKFIKEHEMTPDILINELQGIERSIFKKLYGGTFSKKIYRLYEYKSLSGGE